MIINKFPDGSSYINSTLLGQQVFRINSYEDLWQLNQFVDAFHSQYSTNIKRINPNIVIPNLIDAQADRRFNKGESSGLKLVLKFLNSLEANFTIFHPHNPEVVEALMDNVEIVDNSEFINGSGGVFAKLFEAGSNLKDTLTLMSSDAGGFKPLMKLCDKIEWKGEIYSASKGRCYIDGKSKLTQLVDRQDFDGKDILIVDDICVFGGTFKGLSKLLRERNCGKLYLAVSHMTVQDLGNDPVTNYFDTVFTTNSKFDTYTHTDGQGYDRGLGVVPTNLQIIKLF